MRFPDKVVFYASRARLDRFDWALENLFPGTTRSAFFRDYMEDIVAEAEDVCGTCPIELEEEDEPEKEEEGSPPPG